MSKYWLLVVCCLMCWSALWKCVCSQGAFLPDCSYLLLPLNISILFAVLWKLNTLILGNVRSKVSCILYKISAFSKMKRNLSCLSGRQDSKCFVRGIQFWPELFKQNCTISVQVRLLTKLKPCFLHLKGCSSQFTCLQSSFWNTTHWPEFLGDTWWILLTWTAYSLGSFSHLHHERLGKWETETNRDALQKPKLDCLIPNS